MNLGRFKIWKIYYIAETISNRSVVYLTRGPLRSLLIILVGVSAIRTAKLALI